MKYQCQSYRFELTDITDFPMIIYIGQIDTLYKTHVKQYFSVYTS